MRTAGKATKTILWCGAKGGTSKSSGAIASAGELAVRGFDVALVDGDPQASLTLALGYESLDEPVEADPVDVRDDATGYALRLYRGGSGLGQNGGGGIGRLLDRASESADIVVVDSPPDVVVTSTTREALRRADIALVPMEATPFDLTAVSGIAALRADLEVPPPMKVVFVRHAANRSLTRYMEGLVEGRFPGSVAKQTIPTDVAAAEAIRYGIPVGWYKRKSRSALAYAALTTAILQQIGLHSQRGHGA